MDFGTCYPTSLYLPYAPHIFPPPVTTILLCFYETDFCSIYSENMRCLSVPGLFYLTWYPLDLSCPKRQDFILFYDLKYLCMCTLTHRHKHTYTMSNGFQMCMYMCLRPAISKWIPLPSDVSGRRPICKARKCVCSPGETARDCQVSMCTLWIYSLTAVRLKHPPDCSFLATKWSPSALGTVSNGSSCLASAQPLRPSKNSLIDHWGTHSWSSTLSELLTEISNMYPLLPFCLPLGGMSNQLWCITSSVEGGNL